MCRAARRRLGLYKGMKRVAAWATSKGDGCHGCFWAVLKVLPGVRGHCVFGGICPCITNTLIKTHQGCCFARAALRSCGLLRRRDLATRVTFVPLNVELVGCRTSRPRELGPGERYLSKQIFVSTAQELIHNHLPVEFAPCLCGTQ